MSSKKRTNNGKRNEIRVHLNFTGFERHPSEVTAFVGLSPAKTWEAGGFIERSTRRYSSNGWRLSPSENYADVEAGIDTLLAAASAHWKELRDLSRESKVELSVVVYVYESAPPLHIRHDQVARVAELNASIDMDLYCLAAR